LQRDDPASKLFIERTQFDLLEERYHALRDVVREAELHTTDAAARMLLQFVSDAARGITEALASRRRPQRPEHAPFLPLDAQKLHRFAQIHRNLTAVIGHVKPSPIPVPPEVANSFRRIVRNLRPNTELLITVGDGSSFTVTEFLDAELSGILAELYAVGVGYRGAEIPHVIHIRIASADVTHVLLHCIFAHEFGHALCSMALPPVTGARFAALEPTLRDVATDVVNAWRAEITADLFAMHLFGPAYVCAAVYDIRALHTMHTASASHPPFALRLRILIDALNDEFRIAVMRYDVQESSRAAQWLPKTQAALAHWRMQANSGSTFAFDVDDLRAEVLDAVMEVFADNEGIIMPLRRNALIMARQQLDGLEPQVYTGALYETEVPDLVRAINYNVVPVEQYIAGTPRYVATASILNAAWECFLGNLNEFSRHLGDAVSRPKVFRLFNDFLLKTLELSEVARRWTEVTKQVRMSDDEPEFEVRPSDQTTISPARSGCVLSAASIKKIATDTGPGTEEWLAITPVLQWDRQAKPGNASIDVRLGQRFRIPQRTRIDSLDHISPQHQRDISAYFDDQIVPVGSYYVLHPRQFVLGVTLEWLRLPWHLCATVIGRSAWGRDGLIVATATTVHPQYAGVLTLELTNVGEIPIRLYPGVSIAQLVVQHVDRPHEAQGGMAFMLSSYPRSADAARDDRKIIQKFSEALQVNQTDIVGFD